MKESKRQPPASDDVAAGGSAKGLRDRRPATSGDSDEAFGARQADGLGLAGIFIEGDDGRFVSALEYLMDQRAADAAE